MECNMIFKLKISMGFFTVQEKELCAFVFEYIIQVRTHKQG
jgi:hypothetical protein